MRKLLASTCLVLCLGVAPFAHAASAAKIDRLMELLKVREISTQAVAEVQSALTAKGMPAEQWQCMSAVFTTDAFVEEVRHFYVQVFVDEAVADQAIAFYSSPAGAKVLDAMLSEGPEVSAEQVAQRLSKDDLAALERFSHTEAGHLMQGWDEKIAPMMQESVRKLAGMAVERCGPLAAAKP